MGRREKDASLGIRKQEKCLPVPAADQEICGMRQDVGKHASTCESSLNDDPHLLVCGRNSKEDMFCP